MLPGSNVVEETGVFSSPRGGMAYTSNVSPEKKAPLFGPFRPNNPAKKGYNKTLNPHPQYFEEAEN
jgi:hypothetical protein